MGVFLTEYCGVSFKYDITKITKYVNMIYLSKYHIMIIPFLKVHGGVTLAL